MDIIKIENIEHYHNIPCVRGRLVLLKPDPLSSRGILQDEPIIISETEKINESDWVYDIDNKFIFKQPLNDERSLSIVNNKNAGYRKVLATPENLFPKVLQMIVDGNLKDQDEVLVECNNAIDPKWNEPPGAETCETFIKLTNNHIQLFPINIRETWNDIKKEYIDYKECKTLIGGPYLEYEGWLEEYYKAPEKL